MDTPIGKSTLGEMLPIFIFIVILLLILIVLIKAITMTSKSRKARKTQLKGAKKEGMSMHVSFHHVSGLPIAENILCEICSFPDRLEFQTGTTKIKLAREKITDMCIKTDTDIQKQAVSSIGGAVAGGLMFGSLGAIIGGRAKNKKVKTVSHYLVITYVNSQGDLTYAGFEPTNSILAATKLVNEFHKLNTTPGAQIEL